MTEPVVERCVVLKVDQGHNNQMWLSIRRPTGEKIRALMPDNYPYFYTEPTGLVGRDLKEAAVRVEEGFKSINGMDLQKVVVKTPGDANRFRVLYDHPHQADIPNTQRVVADLDCLGVCDLVLIPPDAGSGRPWMVSERGIHHVTTDVPPGTMETIYWDIEVASDGHIVPGSDGRYHNPVVSIAVKDPHHDKHPESAQWMVWNYYPDDARVLNGWHQFDMNTENGVWVWCMGYSNERQMLEAFAGWLKSRSPDGHAGWYSSRQGGKDGLKGFDWPYLVNRMKTLGIRMSIFGDRGITRAYPANMPGTHLVDLLRIHQRQQTTVTRDNRLATVAQAMFGIELEKHVGNISHWWKNDLRSLIDYNLKDVEATALIDQMAGYSDFAYNMMFMTFVDEVEDIWSASVFGDVEFLRMARQRNIVLPMRPTQQSNWQFEGGEVAEPVIGMHKNVLSGDITSQYPASVMACLIGHENYVPLGQVDALREEGVPMVCIPDVEHHFRVDMMPMLPTIVEKWWNLKAEYTKQRDDASTPEERRVAKQRRWATKIALNALSYGIHGYDLFRMFTFNGPYVAESITAMGRQIIRACKDAIEDMDRPIIISDTDSVYWCGGADTPEDLIKEGKAGARAMEEASQAMARSINAPRPEWYRMEFEALSSRVLVCPAKGGKDDKAAKKRYAGVTVNDAGRWLEKPKLFIKGFDAKRSDSPPYGVDVQKELFRRLLVDEEDPEAVFRWLNVEYAKVAQGHLDPIECGLGPTKKCKKPPERYGTKWPGRPAAYSNANLEGIKIRADDRFHVIYIKGVPKDMEETSALAIPIDSDMDLPEGFVVDYERHAKMAVMGVSESIFRALGMGGRFTHKTGHKRRVGLGNHALADWC